MLWRSVYKIFLKEYFDFLPWNFPQKYSSANKSSLGSGGTFNTLNITLLLFCLSEEYIWFFADPLNWVHICICYPWYWAFGVLERCLWVISIGLTAAVWGCKQQQLQDVLCLSMEAFGNGHKICHVKKTLLNTSEMGCRMRPELKRPHLLPL